MLGIELNWLKKDRVLSNVESICDKKLLIYDLLCYFPLLIFFKSIYCSHAYIETVNSWIQPGLEFVETAKGKAKGWRSLKY